MFAAGVFGAPILFYTSGTIVKESDEQAMAAASTAASARAAIVARAAADALKRKNEPLRFVYRGLAFGENPAVGLVARVPTAGNSPMTHVAGREKIQWIPTSKSLIIAREIHGKKGCGVVAIDLSKVVTMVVDISGGVPGAPPGSKLHTWAREDQEVLIRLMVPASAVSLVP